MKRPLQKTTTSRSQNKMCVSRHWSGSCLQGSTSWSEPIACYYDGIPTEDLKRIRVTDDDYLRRTRFEERPRHKHYRRTQGRNAGGMELPLEAQQQDRTSSAARHVKTACCSGCARVGRHHAGSAQGPPRRRPPSPPRARCQ